MNSCQFLYLLIIIPTFSYCLKAKKSPFDINNNSPASVGVVAGILATPTTTGGSSSTTTSVAPSNISYGASSTFKMIPGVAVNYTPTVTGTVESWSITPELPTGLSFNTTTGAITGIPSTSYLVSGFPLTTFTISAKNGTAAKDFPLSIQVLKTGENVWTVINGVSGRHTNGANNTIKYDSTCDCIYAAGLTQADLDGQTNPSIGNNQVVYLTKYSLGGEKIWTRLYGTAAAIASWVSGLTVDPLGNIYLTGGAGTGNFNGFNITAGYVGYIIKYDPNGTLLWTNCSDTAYNHYYSGIVIDNSGDLIAAGSVYGTSVNGMTNSSSGDQAIIIQKFNSATGARISGVTVPGNSARGTDGLGLAKDGSGNLFVSAVTRSSSYCGTGGLDWRPALFRFNSSLTYLGCTGVTTGSYVSFGFGATIDASGNAYISGYTKTATGTFDGLPVIGNGDGYVVKFNNSGVKQWTKLIGVAGAGTAILAVAAQGSNLYFAGYTSGNLPAAGTLQGTQDMFVGKYDTNGNQPDSSYWTKLQGIQNGMSCTLGAPVGLNGNGCFNGIAFDASSTLYSFGNTTGTISGVTNPATPNNSLFLVRNVQ